MQWLALYCPQLLSAPNPSPSELAAHTQSLQALAIWAGRFTPNVCVEGDCGLLLEVSNSLKLFGGLTALLRILRGDLEAMGYHTQLAGAPTARAAWWLALANQRRFLNDVQHLRNAIFPLPLEILSCDAKTHILLRNLGLRSIGDLLKLPREGIARRCGQPFLNAIDQALALQPEAHAYFQPPPYFDLRLELPAEIHSAEALLFAFKRLFVQLGGFLSARMAAVQILEIDLEHREPPATSLRIGLVEPSRDIDHLMHLLRERLNRVQLPQPVRALRLSAHEIRQWGGKPTSFLHDEIAQAQELPALIEQLRARLGPEKVQGLALVAEHRPEKSGVACDLGVRSMALKFGDRPFWLLEQPQRLQEHESGPWHAQRPLKLVAGPERIRCGWWDGNIVWRDYFVAQTEDLALLWVYREPGRAWYLHGHFA